MEVTVCKIPVEDGSGFFRLEVEWSTDRFRVIVFHIETVWTGKVTVEEIKSLSHCLSMNVEDYMCETRKALSSQGGALEFSYAIENGRFLWKKLIDNDTELKIKFGSILLEEVPPFEMFECMLDAVSDVNHQLLGQVKMLEQGKQHLETEKEELLRKLTQYQKEKIEMEETLYSNFLDILNAKKKRITMLEKHINTHQLTVGTSKQGKSSSKTIVFESDSDPDDRREEVGDTETKTLRLPIISDRPMRPIIEDSDDDESPPKILLKRKQQTKRKSKTSLTTISTSSRRKEEKSRIGLPDLALDQPSTSGNLNTPKLEEISHYDSETDVDQCTDDENVKSLKVTAKPIDICMDNLFDDVRKPAPTCTLPKRIRRQPVPELSENIVQAAFQAIPSVRTKSSGSASNQDRKKFNTQDLLDELIN